MILAICAVLATGTVFAGQEKKHPNGPDWTLPLQKCWFFGSDAMSTIPVASDNNNNFILPESSGVIKGIDSRTGKLLWKMSLGGELELIGRSTLEETRFFTATVIGGDLGAGSASGKDFPVSLVGFDSNSGIANTIAKLSLDLPLRILEAEGSILVFGAAGKIEAISYSGNRIWRGDLGRKPASDPFIAGPYAGIGTEDGELLFLSKETGKREGTVRLYAPPSGPTAFFGTSLYVADLKGNVYAIDAGKKRIKWVTRTGASAGSFARFRGNLIVASNDNYVYMLSKRNGGKLWKTKLAGRLLGGALLDDNHGAFLSQASTGVDIIRLKDGKLVNRYDLGKERFFVSAPVFSLGILAVATQKGITGLGPAGSCPKQ